MSRTDKDRPWWVQVEDEAHGLIDHDHRTGVCIISNDRRDRFGWRNNGHHHWRNCKKRVEVHYTCTKDDPYRLGYSRWTQSRGFFRRQTCWTTVCNCAIPEAWRDEVHGCTSQTRVQCIGHTRIEHDPTIPCSCDDWPPRPTCTPTTAFGSWSAYIRGGVPSDFVRKVYHRPERAKARAALDNLRRRYNAGQDLEDESYESNQARNSARWIYW